MMHTCLAENTTNLSHRSCQTAIKTLTPGWSQTYSMPNLVMYCGIIVEIRKTFRATFVCSILYTHVDEGVARADRARSAGEGEPVVDPIQASASDASGSAGGAAGPHHAPHLVAAGKERQRTPDLAVPYKKKQGFGGVVTRTRARIIEAELESNGEAANALATNPVGSESGSTGGAGERAGRARVWFDVGRAGAALAAVSGGTAVRRDRTLRSSGALDK